MASKSIDQAPEERDLAQANRELRESNDRLQAELEELRRKSDTTNRVVAGAMHELNTPIGSILILAGLLAEHTFGPLADKETDCARKIFKAGSGLQELVADLGQVFRVRADRIEVEPQPLRLSDLVSRLEEKHEEGVGERGPTLVVELARDAPETVCTDPPLLEQLLGALLRNAVLATTTGEVVVRMARDPAQPEEAIRIEIEDGGEAVAEGVEDALFVPFSDASTARRRRLGEAGLGLPLAKELAGLLGIDLSLRRGRARGNTYVARVPVADRS